MTDNKLHVLVYRHFGPSKLRT